MKEEANELEEEAKRKREEANQLEYNAKILKEYENKEIKKIDDEIYSEEKKEIQKFKDGIELSNLSDRLKLFGIEVKADVKEFDIEKEYK